MCLSAARKRCENGACDLRAKGNDPGTVQLAVTIKATGLVDAVRVVKLLEPGLEQECIVEAINKWSTPVSKDDNAVAVQMEVELGYSLR